MCQPSLRKLKIISARRVARNLIIASQLVIFFFVFSPFFVFADQIIDLNPTNSPAFPSEVGQIGRAGGVRERAIPFTTTETNNNAEIVLCVWKTGTPTDDLKISIQEDSGGFPDGVDISYLLLDGGVMSASSCSVPVSLGSITGLSLLSGTDYWLVADRTGADSDTDSYNWFQYYTDTNYESAHNEGSGWSVYGVGDTYNPYGSIILTTETPPQPQASSTSSIDQTQTNLFYGFLVFFLTFWFVVWSFKKRN